MRLRIAEKYRELKKNIAYGLAYTDACLRMHLNHPGFSGGYLV